jgi:hypothetical protein
LPEIAIFDHFLPFFDPKTPFFGIFWHPETPPSKTPFLAVLPPPAPRLRERPPPARSEVFSLSGDLSAGMRYRLRLSLGPFQGHRGIYFSFVHLMNILCRLERTESNINKFLIYYLAGCPACPHSA